jgi:hypothetical protein
LYRIAPSPSIPLPPLAQAARLVFNWISNHGRTAVNVMYALLNPPQDPTNPATLLTVANNAMTAFAGSGLPSNINQEWTLQKVRAHDASSSSGAAADSSHAIIPGTNVSDCSPPQTAVCISWHIAAAYRGGKPRTYLPGVPVSAFLAEGDSKLQSGYAIQVETNAGVFMTGFNALALGATTATLGTVSYHSGHAVRPVPLWRPFVYASCHERADSQRRRSGKESAFPVVP